jgi:ABC-type transporter MlaC component
MFRILQIAAVVIAMTLGVAIPHHVHADEKQDRAIQVTERLLAEAHTALTGPGNGPALRVAIADAFAFDVWERYLIESRSEAFSDDQRSSFRSLLPGFLAHLYQNQFDKGLNQAPTLGDARKVRRDVLVSSTFLRPNGGDLPVDWRVRDFPDRGPQVIDVMVGGTSFLVLKREEFTAMIDSGGAEAVLSHMQRNSL